MRTNRVFIVAVIISLFFLCKEREAWHTNYPTGQLYEKYLTIKKGGMELKHGKYKSWYKNGQIQQECFYKEGKKAGTQTVWYENGNKMMVTVYRNGKQDGKEVLYDDTGKKQLVLIYKKGILFSEEKVK
jgi:antitoxin component YwqK of YwqJK toxin-antitoxin module